MSKQIKCNLDIKDNTLPNYRQFMDIKTYKAIGINGGRCVVCAKNLQHAKLLAITKLGCKCKEIYRI